MFSHNIYNLATLCNYDVRIEMKVLGYVCVVILLATLIFINKLIAEAVIMTMVINDYSFWFVIASILLGLVVSLALSSIILKLIYKVYKNIL